jgi:8-oxo-dGTP pyrophosphatase MutT (NUDIX family)
VVSRGGAQFIPRPAHARRGDPPPWAALEPGARRFDLATVRRRLSGLASPAAPIEVAATTRAAAVLVPVFEEHGEARVILTKRPETMPSHRGEIAFPGGKVDHERDPDAMAAALREAEEEIGLAPADVDVVAELDGIGTMASAFAIRPFVGVLADRPQLAPHPYEVVTVFDVAVSELLDEATFHEEIWEREGPSGPVTMRLHFYELPGETVWGATARILTNLLRLLTTPDR